MNEQFHGYRTLAWLAFSFGWFFFVFSAYILLDILFMHTYVSGYVNNPDPVGQAPVIISGFVVWAFMMRATTILGTSLQLEDHQILITSWYGRMEPITNTIQEVDCNISFSVMPGVCFFVQKPFPNVIRIKTSNRNYYITLDNKATMDELLAYLTDVMQTLE